METWPNGTRELAIRLSRAGAARPRHASPDDAVAHWTTVIRDALGDHGDGRSFVSRAVIWLRGGGSRILDLGQGVGTEDSASLANLSKKLGRVLSICVREAQDGALEVMVEAFVQGLRHGFTDASPSAVKVASGHVAAEHHHLGLSLMPLVLDPVCSIGRLTSLERGPVHDAIFPDRRHSRVIAAVRVAEKESALVVLSPMRLDDLHAVLVPGATRYTLLDGVAVASLVRSTKETGRCVVRVWHSGAEASMVRQVAGQVEGVSERRPGTIESRLAGPDLVEKVRFFANGRRLPVSRPDPEDEVLSRVARLPA